MNEHRQRQLLDEARYYMDHAMWLHAAQMYQRLIDQFPEDVRYRLDLSVVYTRMGNLDAAEKVLLKALNIDPGNVDVLHALGLACHEHGDDKRAMFYLQKIAAYPTAKVQYSLGVVYWRLEQYRNAQRHLRRASELDPADVHIAIALAETQLQLGDFNDTIQTLLPLMSSAPREPMLFLLHARACMRLGAWTQALFSLEHLLSIDPEHRQARYMRGIAQIELHQYDEAERTFKEVLSRDEGDVVALMHLGNLALLRSNRGKAADYYRRILTMDPEHVEALEKMQYLSPDGKFTS